jgi:hypothetical protein
MNYYKILGRMFFLSAYAAISVTSAKAQDKTSAVKDMVEGQQYTFHARTALPQSGPSKVLNTEYYLKMIKDSLVCELPFYGRAYSSSYGSTSGGFHFTSTKFEYTSKPAKKGGWEIVIKPKDVQDFRQFSLSLSTSGFGTLQVLSNNRQPISFTGDITSMK